jgi:hypothetical protein
MRRAERDSGGRLSGIRGFSIPNSTPHHDAAPNMRIVPSH